MSHHLPECFLSNPCNNEEGHSIITVVGGVPLGRDLCEACMADCICDRLRKAEQRAIAAMREPGRVRVLVEEAEQRGFHRGYRTAVDYWRTVSTRYGKRKYREGREDAARDVEAMRPRLYPDFTCINYDAAVAAARGEKS